MVHDRHIAQQGKVRKLVEEALKARKERNGAPTGPQAETASAPSLPSWRPKPEADTRNIDEVFEQMFGKPKSLNKEEP